MFPIGGNTLPFYISQSYMNKAHDKRHTLFKYTSKDDSANNHRTSFFFAKFQYVQNITRIVRKNCQKP
jgi:hypothetical protein